MEKPQRKGIKEPGLLLAEDEESQSSRPFVTVTVPEHIRGERADKVVAQHFDDWSREKLAISFESHEVLINGQPILKKTRVSSGDIIHIALPELEEIDLEPVDIPLEILFEDEHMAAINKPAGIVVHPGSGISGAPLVHAMLHHTGGALARAGGKERPGIVHRLDRDTTGVMLFAKTDTAYYKLNRQFARRLVHKEYLALVRGVPRLQSGTILKPIARHTTHRTKMAIAENGRPAHTDWKIERAWDSGWALLRCRIHTGRTHQIRVHLSDLGHPLLGDYTYGYKHREGDPVASKKVMLHSAHTWLDHPILGCLLDLTAPLPEAFSTAIATLDATG